MLLRIRERRRGARARPHEGARDGAPRRAGAALRWGVGAAAAAWLGLPAGAVGAPPEGVAVARARPLPMSPALARGRLEHRTLEAHGVPIRGAWQAVRIEDDGAEQIVASRLPTAAPQLRPDQARVSAEAVPGLLAAHRGRAQEPALERPPALVYVLVLGQPVLAWEAQLAFTSWPEPSRATVWVSAATGRVLREVERVQSSRARAFLENPSKTPEPVELELVDLHVTDAGHPLTGPRVQSFNCVAEEPAEISPWHDDDECYPVQLVRSDADGNFFVPLPDVVVEADNVADSDPYAELSMYVHAERFIEAMRAKGVLEYRCALSSMLANVRSLEPSARYDWSPLDNAYYTDQCDPEKGPTMLFGQGSQVDFGYDGDVVYHELGHGMVAHLAPEGLTDLRLRSDATVSDAVAINEGLADYFAVMLTDDPHLAEYVGRFWAGGNGPFIRDAENGKACPEQTINESHADGEPLTAALWATRKRLSPAGKAALDAVVLEALAVLPPDCDFETIAGALVASAERRGELGSDDLVLLQRSLEARGLVDCPRVIDDPELVRSGRVMYLRRVDDSISPFYPGPMQLRYEVPANAHDMVVTFGLDPRSGDDEVEARVLVKRGDAPISFEHRLVAVDDPPVEPGDDDPVDPVQELVLVTGDWDLELVPDQVADAQFQVILDGLEPGQVLHLSLVNVARANAVATRVLARSSTALPEPDEAADEAAATDALDPLEEVLAGPGAAGCACRSGSRGGGAWGLGLALALGLRGRRRRRDRCGR